MNRRRILVITFCFSLLFSCFSKKEKKEVRTGQNAVQTSEADSEGMVLIPGGEFMMGANSSQSNLDEYPKHKMIVEDFYMDIHEVTNRQFKKFVEETGYLTVAERDIGWEEIEAQVPPGTPRPHDSLLQAASMVFKVTEQLVDLNDPTRWWHWVKGADWRHPEGPGSTIEERLDHPVVHIS